MASVYTITTGETLNTHESFKSHLPWGSCKNVSNSKDCDVILAFCPVTSRVGTDIEAALRIIPEGKPLALVVLHHTFDSNYTLPDTKRFMKRPDSITVDCLFTDDGLMRCPCNDDAVRAVTKFLQQHGKHSLNGKLGLGLLILILFCVAFAKIAAEIINTKEELQLMQQKYKGLEKEANKLREQAADLNRTKTELELRQQKYAELEKEAIKLKEQVADLNHTKKELELMQKNYTELERESNKLKEQVAELNHTKKELERMQKNYTELERELNKLKEQVAELNHTKKELEWMQKRSKNAANMQQNNKECERKANTFRDVQAAELERKTNTKNMSPEEKVKNSKEIEENTEKQDDKSEQLLPALNPHDTPEARNDEPDEKYKQPAEKEAGSVTGLSLWSPWSLWHLLLLLILCLALYIILRLLRQGTERINSLMKKR